MTESEICHRPLAATSLPSASIATLGARGLFSHLPAAFLPAEPTEARKLPNKANRHIRQILSMTYKVSVLSCGPAAGTEQSRARQGAGPHGEPDRAPLVRAWARGLPPAALCGYVRQAHRGRRAVGTATFAANHTTERAGGKNPTEPCPSGRGPAARKNRTEPCPSGRGPFSMAFFGRGEAVDSGSRSRARLELRRRGTASSD